jgi:hypothetical protein
MGRPLISASTLPGKRLEAKRAGMIIISLPLGIIGYNQLLDIGGEGVLCVSKRGQIFPLV